MTDHPGRIARIRDSLGAAGVEGLLITNLTNVRYLTGFSGTNGQVLITADHAYFMSDPRYAARAASLVQGAEVVIYPDRLTDVLSGRLTAARIARLGVESASMTLVQHADLGDKLRIELVATKNVVEDVRRVKDRDELDLIRRAVALADATFAWVLEHITPGVSEREIALDLEVRMRSEGADEVSFPPIVSSGPLSAHIHHTASERTFEKGDLVLLDFGCRVEGYCSDLTRTVVIGPAPAEQRTLYALVLDAQRAGQAAIKPGTRAADADRAARVVIDEAGHGEDFGHGLGHGVGIEIHEAPAMNRISEDVLMEGDVVTVEPGVYLDGVGGIRIEDCVVVSEGGAETIGSAPKEELIEL